MSFGRRLLGPRPDSPRLSYSIAAALALTLAASAPAAAISQCRSGARRSVAPVRQSSPRSAKGQQTDPFTLGMNAYEAGDSLGAIQQLQQAEKKEPKDPIVQSWLGFISFKMKRYEEAIQYFNRSLHLSSKKDTPANADVYNNLGNAYMANKQVERAIDAYQHAVDILKGCSEKRAEPYYNLGNALYYLVLRPPNDRSGLRS